MSEPIRIGLTEIDVAARIGQLMLTLWTREQHIRALEQRVDALEPPDAVEPSNAAV